MKKLLSFLLISVLLLPNFLIPASAASSETISQNTTLTKKFNVYQDLTIAPGVTLTTKMAGNEPQGIEMHGALTLGAGAKIVGRGIILMYRGSSYSGMTFYYNFRGEYRAFPDIATAYERYQNADDYVFQFRYNDSLNGWVWSETINGGDPFEPPAASNVQDANSYAETLKALGLMKGVGTKPDGTTDFALNKDLTRVEAVVMMIRLLGKEQEALNGDWSHPFSDVPGWAEAYVGYAYTNHITNGVSDTEFGSNSKASASMYFTFILRSMGYQDSSQTGAIDFTWTEAPFFARSIGINIINEQLDHFKRAEAAIASFQALDAVCKDGTPLCDKLIEQNVFTREQYDTVMNPHRAEH